MSPRLPGTLVPFALLAVAYVSIPLVMLAARVPWSRVGEIVMAGEVRTALTLSVLTCLVAVAIDVLIGVPAALCVAAARRGGPVLRVIFSIPLALPPVVAGLALLMLFGRHGPVGVLLDQWGMRVVFTVVAVVMAQVFVSLPFLVATVESALRARAQDLEEAVRALGASPAQCLRWVTLPAVRPALVRGTCLALARCLGEFGATLTFAGSRPGVTRTMPLEIYLARESDSDAAVVLAVALLAVAMVVVAVPELVERAWQRASRRERRFSAASVSWWLAARLPRAGNYCAVGVSPSAPALVQVTGTIPERDWSCEFSLLPGQATAVMGPNGAGKSTLAQVVAGTLCLSTGQVNMDGRLVDGPEFFAGPRERQVAFLGQNPLLIPHWDVLANVMLPLRVRGWDPQAARVRAREALERVEALHLAPRPAEHLSGGERSRVALARAIVMDPQVLILDEPTAALDVEATSRVMGLIADLSRSHSMTTLLVTHDLSVALAVADELVIIEEGRVAESGSPQDLLQRPRSSFMARLAGFSVLPGRVVALRDGQAEIRFAGGSVWLSAMCSALCVGDAVTLYCPPGAIRLCPPGPEPGFRAKVLTVTEPAAGLLVVALRAGDGRLLVPMPAPVWAALAAVPGDWLDCEIDPQMVTVVRG